MSIMTTKREKWKLLSWSTPGQGYQWKWSNQPQCKQIKGSRGASQSNGVYYPQWHTWNASDNHYYDKNGGESKGNE